MFPWIEQNLGLLYFWLLLLNHQPEGMDGEWSLYFMSSQVNEVTESSVFLSLDLRLESGL